MASGSFSGSICSGHYAIRVDWTATQNIVGNYSTVTCKLYFVNDWSIDIGARSNTVNIAGTNYTITSGALNTQGTHYIGSCSKNIAHSADGKLPSFSMSANFDFRTTIDKYYASITASGSGYGDNIPRQSKPSLSKASFNIGETVRINTNRQSTSFTHTITISYGSYSATLATGVGDYWDWNTNNYSSLYSQIPNSNKGTGTITVYTYYSGSTLGTNPASFTANVVNSNPTLTSISYTQTNQATQTLLGNNSGIVQNKSALSVTFSGGAAKHYSTIKSYNVVIGSKIFTSTTSTVTVSNVDNGNPIQAYIIDTRGNQSNKVSKTLTTYYPYANPFVTNAAINRINQIEATATLSFTSNFAEIMKTKNQYNAKYRYKISNSDTWSDYTTLTLTNYAYSGNLAQSFDINKSYNIEIVLADYYGATTTSILLSSAQPELSIRKDCVGINTIPTGAAALEVNGAVIINGVNILNIKKLLWSGEQSSGQFLLNDDIRKYRMLLIHQKSAGADIPIAFTGQGLYVSGCSGYCSNNDPNNLVIYHTSFGVQTFYGGNGNQTLLNFYTSNYWVISSSAISKEVSKSATSPIQYIYGVC